MLKPYWFQQAAQDAVFEYFASGKTGNPLICLPTGTGKSVVIALFVKHVLQTWPGQRIMMLTHVKELIEQNAVRMLDAWPLAPLGIYSAGLKQRDTAHPIIFGGVASAVKNVEAFGRIDVLVIDEAHLLGPDADSMYQTIITKLKERNPGLVVIGLTATAFRMGQGLLTDEGIFTDIAYDLTNVDGFNRLVAEGYLAPLYPKRTKTEYDVSSVGMVKGDFNKGELENATNQDTLTRKILAEMCDLGTTRDHWLIFASGTDHSDRIANLLETEFGVSAVSIHSKIGAKERDARIGRYKSGEVRCAVNNNVLTTGFDSPAIDFIGMLRPTMSPGLWVQMCGRGTRISKDTGKQDCIVLDFAGNTRRLGPINDPVKPRKKGAGGGDAPVRICDSCGTYNHASARTCYCCGHEFTFQEKLRQQASTEELLRSDAPIIETFDVKRVFYHQHVSKKNPNAKPCIRVQYVTGIRAFDEWWHLDAGGLAGKESRDKWRARTACEPPTPATCAPYESATAAAMSIISQLREPKAIRVWVNRPQPQIQSVEF